MPLKPTMSTGSFEIIEAGTHVARLYSIIDLGVQDTEYMGEKKETPQVRLTWELPNETKNFEGVMKPLVIGNDYTNSMGSKANLRKVIEGLLGVQLTDAEAANFDNESYKALLGKACLLTVIHKESKGKTYANVGGVAPLVKGMTCPPQFNDNVFYEIGVSPISDLEHMPKFVREKIMKSHEMRPHTSTLSEEESLALSMAREGKRIENLEPSYDDEINSDGISF